MGVWAEPPARAQKYTLGLSVARLACAHRRETGRVGGASDERRQVGGGACGRSRGARARGGGQGVGADLAREWERGLRAEPSARARG